MALVFLLTFFIFMGLDYLWTGLLMKNYYLHALGPLARAENGAFKPQMLSLLGIYLVLALLVTFFIVPMFRALGLNWQTVLIAFGFGVGLYAFYELTNFAILKDWPAQIVLVDILWGGVLVALGSVGALYIKDIFF